MNHEIFQSAWWAQAVFPTLCELWALFPLILLGDSFPGLKYFLHMLGQINTQLNTQGGPSAHLWSSLSVQLSPLALSPVVSILLLLSESQLCFLNSGSLLGSTWVPFPASWLENSLKAVSWQIVITGLILSFSSSGFTVFHCLVSSVLNCCFIYCPLLAALGKGVDLVTITLSWQEVKGRSSLLPPPLASS